MPNTYKSLGQSAPSATTETTIYTCPSSTQTIVSSLVICNRSGSADTIRVAHNVGGGATANSDYWYYGYSVSGNTTVTLRIGACLQQTDKIKVYSTNGTCTFNLYGNEIT